MIHTHYELMKEFLADAAETSIPHTRWQYRRMHGEPWVDCSENPRWRPEFQYRRKPDYMVIGGHPYCLPLTERPESGTVSYMMDLLSPEGTKQLVWGVSYSSFVKHRLKEGLLFPSPQQASAVSRAILEQYRIFRGVK